MTTDQTRRRELRDFLIARRGAISPASVGLSAASRRRTPGLRREELATIAGVGVTWYTWLEQGRDIRASADTLERIAHALRLTATDTAYFFALAGVPRGDAVDQPSTPELAGVQGVLDAFMAPAFVVGPCWDVEAFNRIADRVYRFADHADPFGRNHMWRFFMDPARRALYLEWDTVAQTAVGVLRAAYARRVGDPYFEALVASLTAASQDFTRLWTAQQTAPLTPDRVRLSVRGLGELRVTSVRLRVAGADDSLLLLLPPADAESAALMRRMSRDRGRAAGVGRQR